MSKMTMYGALKFLSPYIKKHRMNFILFYFGWLIDSVFTVITPILFAVMIDGIVYYRDISVLLRASSFYLAMVLFSSLLYFFIYSQHNHLMSLYRFEIRLDIFKKMQMLTASELSQSQSGDLINLLFSDSNECVHFVVRNVVHLINGVLKGIFYLIYIYIIHIKAGITVTLLLPLAAYSTFKFSNRIQKLSKEERAYYGHYLSWLTEILGGLKDLRLLCAQSLVMKELTGHLKKLYSTQRKISLSSLASRCVIDFVNLVLQLAIYAICAHLVVRGEITIGSVLILVSFIFTLKDTVIIGTARSLIGAQSRIACMARIKVFFDREDESSWPGKKILKVDEGQLDFKEISFSYGENRVLEEFTLSIKPKSTVAIAGRSGCGKSTLVSLLTGMYEPQEGGVLIDGKRIDNYTLRSLRQEVGVVHQDFLIAQGTIRENLLLGNKKCTDQSLWKACRDAGLEAFIKTLPGGLDTVLGTEGQELSGGQQQRLVMARVLIKDPPILVMDEATSSLDRETEREIHQNWKKLFQNRTVILIAHNLESIMQSDHVYLMGKGKVLNSGVPEEMALYDKSFRELFALKEEVEVV